MRVLHVIPSVAERSGGPATAIVPMCRALMQQGIEVLLLSTTDGLSGECEVTEYKGVPALLFPPQWGASFKYSRPLASWLTANIRNFDIAHIHAVFNHSSVAASRACREAGVPFIVRPLGTLDPWSMTQKSLRKRLFWQVSGKGMLGNAAAVHYTSEMEKISTERYLGLNHGRVIALGVDANGSSSKRQVAREPYVLVLSRLHPKKGLDVLIDAFLLLVQEGRLANWRLVIAGDGPGDYVSKLKAKVAASSQPDRITFTGWLEGEKKRDVMGGASLLALPSHQENFGLCVMEALAHSVPVLVSPNVNLAAEIVSANAGWIAAVDKDALAARLREALSDEDELLKRGRAGRQLSQKYSWENAARGLVDLYKEILPQRRKGAKAQSKKSAAETHLCLPLRLCAFAGDSFVKDMTSPTYTEFEWRAEAAANGESGEKLTRVFVDLVKKLDGVRSICDLGCGNGHITGRLAALGYHVTGVDASASGIQIARRAYPGVEFVHTLIDRDLNVGQFDLVISSDVIEHLYRPSDLLDAAVSQLKPGAHMLLGTPYHGYLKNLVLAATGKMDAHFSALHDGGHIKFFSVRTLSQLVRSHGFQDLSFTFYGRAPWLWKNMICHARKSTR